MRRTRTALWTGIYRWDSEGRITVIEPEDNDTNPTLRFSYTAYGGAGQPPFG